MISVYATEYLRQMVAPTTERQLLRPTSFVLDCLSASFSAVHFFLSTIYLSKSHWTLKVLK